jgi:hypothetical protein
MFFMYYHSLAIGKVNLFYLSLFRSIVKYNSVIFLTKINMSRVICRSPQHQQKCHMFLFLHWQIGESFKRKNSLPQTLLIKISLHETIFVRFWKSFSIIVLFKTPIWTKNRTMTTFWFVGNQLFTFDFFYVISRTSKKTKKQLNK